MEAGIGPGRRPTAAQPAKCAIRSNRQNSKPNTMPEAMAASATGTSTAATAAVPAARPSVSGRLLSVHQPITTVSNRASRPASGPSADGPPPVRPKQVSAKSMR